MTITKKFASLLGATLVAGVLAACGETEVKEVENADSEKAAEEAPAETEAPEDKVYKVGETVSVDGIEITINSATFTEPAEYSEAANGKVLTLDVTAKNANEEQVFIDNTEFSIYDAEGMKMEDYFGYDEMAISDTINAGKQLQGKLYFDVKEQTNYELIYTPSFSFDSKEVVFDIAVQ